MTFYTASGARRTGDEYQDLQSAEVLIEWLEHPEAYRWVRLETTKGSLDDVQAERADGTRRLLQVKFTTDATAEWNWEHLLEQEAGKQGPKASLLQKWKRSLDDVEASGAVVSEAALLTNRAASASIRALLSDSGQVDFGRLPNSLQSRISTQLGGDDAASKFFASFHFFFKERSFEALDDALQKRFYRLGGSNEGWTNLLRKIRYWINRRNEPAPDGTISLPDVRAAARWHLPPQIPQDFLVPDDYVAPEGWSHTVILPQLRAGDDGLTVVTGSPGAGKSTYLSWLVDKLRDRENIPVVRHHYFLSPTDATPHRTDWETAADAIIGQLRLWYPELVRSVDQRNPLPSVLHDFLAAAGREREGQDPLVIILDGLDHVWRDTGSAEGLRRLFDLLLPVPEGVSVVVGTQDIDIARIPQKLRNLCPRDQWNEIPILDGGGVHEWLKHHEHELGLPEQEEHANRILGELADAFRDVSGGHPLVLHYTLSAVRQRVPPIRSHQVRSLPSFDPSSSVATYYRALWESINAEGHHLLHLLAGFKWAWPRDGLVQCLASQADPIRLEHAEQAIRHVLGSSRAGVTAFHESLLAFVRSLPDHLDAVRSLQPRVVDWLAHRAPGYWRWRHEWEERARDEDTAPLISSANIDWCIDSLAEGHSRTEVAQVVAASGWSALKEGRLGVATERHYIDEYLGEAGHAEGVLSKLAWLGFHSHDPRTRELELDLFLSRKTRASVEEIEAAAEVAFTMGRLDLSHELAQEGGERWNATARRSNGLGGAFSSLERSLPSLIAASLSDPSQGPFQRYTSEHEDEPDWCPREPYAKALARHCVVGSDTRAIREELRFLANRSGEVSFEAVDEIVRLAWRDGFDPDRWIVNPEARRSGLFRCDRLWVRRDAGSLADAPQEVSFLPISWSGYYEGESMFVELAHSYFFSCLANAAEDRPSSEAAGLEAGASEARELLAVLRDLASEAADRKKQDRAIGAAWFIARLADLDPPEAKQNDLKNRFARPEPVARIVVAIAQDLEELQHAERGEASLTGDTVRKAIDGAWTWARIWIEDRVERRLTMSDPDAVRLLIDRERSRLESSKDFLHTRAEEYASLAQFCQLHQVPADETRSFARLAARNLMGHGFRKDIVLFNLLTAVRTAPVASGARTLSRLRSISPIVQVVDDITDGSETRHLKRELAEVVGEATPEALPPYLRALQRDYNHWQVEKCFTDLAKAAPLDSVYQKALASTWVHEEALAALQRRADDGDEDAESVLADTVTFQGRQAVSTEPDAGSGTSLEEDDESPPVIENFAPERLSEYVQAVQDAHIYGEEALAAWTIHWRSEDPEGLLAAVTRYWRTHGRPHESQTAKLVVELALERSGLSAAWDWLVAYHGALYGWIGHAYPLADVKWIWEFVGARFEGRWLDFITETSRPRWGSAGDAPAWDVNRMTAYLEVVGQADRAEEAIGAAILWGTGLAADIHLPDHALSLNEAEVPLALRLLVDRLDCPSRMVQERAAWSLAELFADTDTRVDTATALLHWHEAESLELRSCMLLVLLHLARTAHGASAGACAAVARKANLVPSIGTDLLLREFGDPGATIAASLDYEGRHSQRPSDSFSSVQDFQSTVGAHLAPIFRSWARRLDRSGIPFSRQWEWEAIGLARRQGLSLQRNAHFDSHYRGGADDPALAINDRLAVVLRSAYLRALHWSIDEAALDVDRAEMHARLVAIVADPAHWAVRPSERPSWWPRDPGGADGPDMLGASVGQAVRNRLEERDREDGEILLFAAGPLGNRPYLRAEVVVAAFLQSAHGPIKPTQRELAEVQRVGCRPVPPRVSLPGNYAPFEPYAGPAGDWMVAPLAWSLLPESRDWILPERQVRGLQVPANWLFPTPPTMVTEPNQVSFTLDDQRVARYHYWHDELTERHHRGAGSRVGGELLISREWLKPEIEAGATLCWVATLWISQRKEYREEFKEPQMAGTWLVGGSHVVWPRPWTPPPYIPD